MLNFFCKIIRLWQLNTIKSFFIVPAYNKKAITTIASFFKLVSKLISTVIVTFAPYIVILIIWQAAVVFFTIPTYLIPSPIEVFEYIFTQKKILLLNSAVTSLEASLGLILAALASIFLGIIALYNLFFIKTFYKLLLLIQIIPLMAIAPLIIIWFGFSIRTKILVVFIICLFPCLLSFLRGNLSLDKEILSLLQSMGASRLQIFKLVVLPSSFYNLFSGLKIAVTYSVTGAVIAEYMGAEKGLGVYLARAISSFDTSALFANIFCIVFITLLFYKIVVIMEKLTTPWNLNKQKETNNGYL